MEEAPKARPSISQLSKTPSWVMLGFLLGALFVWRLPHRDAPLPARPVVLATPEPARPSEPPQISTIEAVFSEWSSYAVWDNDVTQVAMWNSAVGDFAECYEVRRVGDTYYFRTIPHLTNRVIRHGKALPPECPLRFTETEEQYREWRTEGRVERPAENLRPKMSVPRALPAMPTPSPSVSPLTTPAPDSDRPPLQMPEKK